MEPSDNANSMKNKKRLKFDWSELLRESDEPTPELIITSSTADAESRNPSENLILDMDAHQNLIDNMEKKKDDEINSSIKRYRDLKKLSRELCDKGAKLDAMLERLEAEKERRKLLAVEKGPNDFVSTKQSANLIKNYFIDASDALGKEQTFSNEGLPSSFTSIFSSHLENIHSRSSVDFDKVSYRPTNGDQHKNQFKREFFARDRGKASSRHQPFQSPMLGSSVTNRDKKSIDHVMSLSYPKPAQDQMVLLDEEDEGQLEVIKRSDEFVECTEDATIYYPSRDDPNSVEICYKDKKCLDPEGYLTSPIMNFYITYLQQQASLSNKGINDYHFFNTYFYKKLQDAVSDKGNEKGVSFAKFRRWWKGVNIFEKAYVLIPIHENLHWSLAIICIPDKKDESGPVILHLDSLELHRSKSIFDNIKSFLIEEWRYLNEQSASLDLLIVDQVWELLPSLIGVTTIAVPQQKNDYDCGLFVLYFMQRFMEEAPERLRKRDLHMFGKRWFKPEDASSLRSRIRRLLIKEFRKVTRDDNDDEPTPTPNNTLGSEMDCTLIDAAAEEEAEVVSS